MVMSGSPRGSRFRARGFSVSPIAVLTDTKRCHSGVRLRGLKAFERVAA